MVSYDSWKQTDLLVTNLRLDPQNPRIPGSGPARSERDLIADLVDHDKVYDLAKSIAENGYHPIESLIVIGENGRTYAVEGNRRLAALKLLLSPETAPESWRRRFQSLANRIDPKSIRKVRVVRAPSREAAAPVIVARHTQTQIASWSSIMQAKCYRNLVSSGLTAQEISEQYGVPLSQVGDFLRMDLMYSIACALDLPEGVREIVHNPRTYPMTTVERLYKYPSVCQFLGISFDERHGVVGRIKASEFAKGYGKIITDIATGEVGSRRVNTTDDMDEYLAKFGEKTPDLRAKGRFTAKSLLRAAKAPADVAGIPDAEKRKRRKKAAPTGLIPLSFACEANNQRVNDFFIELQRLPVARFRNAVSLMFRSLLELSLAHYLDRTRHLPLLLERIRVKREKKGQRLRGDYAPTLKEMLTYIVDDSTRIISNPLVLKAVKRFRSDQDPLISVDTLNDYVHNPHVPPDEAALRRFWTQLSGLFEILLVEPEDDRSS